MLVTHLFGVKVSVLVEFSVEFSIMLCLKFKLKLKFVGLLFTIKGFF